MREYPKEFKPIGKGVTEDAVKKVSIVSYTAVIVSGIFINGASIDNSTKNEIQVRPYTRQTRDRKGFIAMMIHEITGLPQQDVFPIACNTLLVALDCKQFDERDNETMIWEEQGLQEHFDAALKYDGVVSMMFWSLDTDAARDGNEWEWCPTTPNKITLVPDGDCEEHWPDYLKPRFGMHEWMNRYVDRLRMESIDEEEKEISKRRIDLHIEAEVPAKHRVFAIFMVFVVIASTLIFSILSLKNEAMQVIYFVPTSVQTDGQFVLVLKLVSGPIMLFILTMLRVAFGYAVKKQKQHSTKDMDTSTSLGLVFVSAGMKLILLVVALFSAPLAFFTAKNILNNHGPLVKTLSAFLSWLNYELAMVFFANNLIETFNGYLGTEVPMILSEAAANLILGITGLTAALLDLVNTVRDNHGINTGCDLSELGNTFRWIAREIPGAFPPEASLELFCTEADITFEQIFNSSYAGLEGSPESGYARYDDGNICTLVCTMPTDNDGRTPVVSYPIWCKDNGFSNGRWTLSSHRADLAHRLCPHVNSTTPHTNMATMMDNMRHDDPTSKPLPIVQSISSPLAVQEPAPAPAAPQTSASAPASAPEEDAIILTTRANQ